jgi:CMP-N,N'-diacetyllegionaminic acid synthase
MNILGLIPARGGSKSIRHKNIADLRGRPLLAYTCEAASGSTQIARVVLSTDDEQIAAVGRRCGVQVPFMRPPELSQDDTPSILVAQHAIRWLADHERWLTDILVLLQPTSPLRQSHHIDAALAAMRDADADTVVSVVKVPHRYSPYNIMRVEADHLRDFWEGPLPFDRFRRQNLPVLYARNGPAVLASRAAVILDRSSFYGERIVPYVMREEDSVDIDTPFDLRLAGWLLDQREGGHE